MRKIEHIGIAVRDLEASNLIFEKLFGAPAYKQEEVASEGVKTSFFMNGPNKIELLEAKFFEIILFYQHNIVKKNLQNNDIYFYGYFYY